MQNGPLSRIDPSGFDDTRSIEQEPDFEARRDAQVMAYAREVMANGGRPPSIWGGTGMQAAQRQLLTGFRGANGPIEHLSVAQAQVIRPFANGFRVWIPGEGSTDPENNEVTVRAGHWEYVSGGATMAGLDLPGLSTGRRPTANMQAQSPQGEQQEQKPPEQPCTDGPGYMDRYVDFVSDNAINVGPYAAALAGGLWPKSLAPVTGGRPPLLGSTNPLTSVPRAFGIPGADTAIARTGAAGIGLVTVGVGFYDLTVELEGFLYAIPSYGNGSCPKPK